MTPDPRGSKDIQSRKKGKSVDKIMQETPKEQHMKRLCRTKNNVCKIIDSMNPLKSEMDSGLIFAIGVPGSNQCNSCYLKLPYVMHFKGQCRRKRKIIYYSLKYIQATNYFPSFD